MSKCRPLQTHGAVKLSAFIISALMIIGGHFPAFAGEPHCADLVSSITEQPKDRRLEENDFTLGRGIKRYDEMLKGKKNSLLDILRGLPKHSTWIDMGAGTARAQRDVFSTLRRFRLRNISNFVAIAYKRPPSQLLDLALAQHHDKFTYLEGGYIENMYASGKLSAYRGVAHLITDDFGGITYCRDLSLLIKIYLDLLKPGGRLVFNIPVEEGLMFGNIFGRYEYKVDAITPLKFVDENGNFAKSNIETLLTFMNEIHGTSVEDWNTYRSVRNGMAGLQYQKTLVIHLRKESGVVQIPKLELVSYEDAIVPPPRVYKINQFH